MPTGSPSLGMTLGLAGAAGRQPEPAQPDQVGQPQREPGRHLQLEPVPRVQHGLAEQRQRAGQGGQCARRSPTGSSAASCRRTSAGPSVNPPLTHILPAGIDGSQDVPAELQPVPVRPGQGQVHAGGRGVHREPPAADQVPVPQRQPGRHGDLQQRQQPAERARLGEGDRRADQPVGLLRQVPERPNTTSAPSPAYKGTWDMAGCGLGPGLVRELRGDLLQPAVLEPGRVPGQRRQQLRLLLQHRPSTT